MRYNEITNEEIDRRGFLRGMLGAGAAAAGLTATDAEAAKKKQSTALSVPKTPQQRREMERRAQSTKIDPRYQIKQGEEISTLGKNTNLEIAVQKAAKANGITNKVELAQFMAQMNHESWDFTKLFQVGDKRVYGGKGFVQLTGKQNYAAASKAIGVDLVNNPAKAADPNIALKIALWFWNTEVKRYAKSVEDFKNTRLITRIINGPALNGLEDRHQKFQTYLNIL